MSEFMIQTSKVYFTLGLCFIIYGVIYWIFLKDSFYKIFIIGGALVSSPMIMLQQIMKQINSDGSTEQMTGFYSVSLLVNFAIATVMLIALLLARTAKNRSNAEKEQ